ncbi:hypothetical protein A3Q56_02968, partial [Intoshia linei]
MLKLRKLAD